MQRIFWKSRLWIAMTVSTMMVSLRMSIPVSGQCFDVEGYQPYTKFDNTNSIKAKQGVGLDFALSLFKSVVESNGTAPKSGNYLISPISINAALKLTFFGARGNTKKELGTVLGTRNEKHKTVLRWYRQMKGEVKHNVITPLHTVKIVDKLYLDKSVNIRKCILAKLNQELGQANFKKVPETSRKLINKWVEENTNKKIVNLIPRGNINAKTKIVMVGAIHLKATWAETFNPKNTFKDNFVTEKGKTKKVNMMNQKTHIPYGTSDHLDCTAVELWYSGYEISMVILLPNSNIRDLMNKLDRKDLEELLRDLHPSTVQLAVPKFKLTQSFELKENLKSLGIRDLFDATKADLSVFTESKNNSVSFFKHKTFIEVNEGGTEPAATANDYFRQKVGGVSKFKVNRPFLFLLMHIKSKHILFMGIINDPTAKD